MVVEQQKLRKEQMVVAVEKKCLDMVEYEQQPQATPQTLAPPLPPSDPVEETKKQEGMVKYEAPPPPKPSPPPSPPHAAERRKRKE